MNKNIVSTIIKRCLGYKKGEKFLIVCDYKLRALAYGFFKCALSLGIETMLLQMKPRKMHGEEPPKAITEALKEADLAILFTSMSLSHTKARKIATSKYGTRIASLPGVTEAILKRSIILDYSALRKKVAKVAKSLTRGMTLEIRTKKGYPHPAWGKDTP